MQKKDKKMTIEYYVPENYFSPRLHVFEELLGMHWNEIDESVRNIQKKQMEHITHDFDLRILNYSSLSHKTNISEETRKALSDNNYELPLVIINGHVKKIGKLLSPTELANIFDGFSVQIPNDPDA